MQAGDRIKYSDSALALLSPRNKPQEARGVVVTIQDRDYLIQWDGGPLVPIPKRFIARE